MFTPCAENIEYRKKSYAIWGSRSEIMRVLTVYILVHIIYLNMYAVLFTYLQTHDTID